MLDLTEVAGGSSQDAYVCKCRASLCQQWPVLGQLWPNSADAGPNWAELGFDSRGVWPKLVEFGAKSVEVGQASLPKSAVIVLI